MGARLRIATVLALLCASAGTAHAQTKGEAEKAILAADAAWLKAYAAKDVDKAVASLDEQGSMLSPNAPIATGKDAVKPMTGCHAGLFRRRILRLGGDEDGDVGVGVFPSVRMNPDMPCRTRR